MFLLRILAFMVFFTSLSALPALNEESVFATPIEEMNPAIFAEMNSVLNTDPKIVNYNLAICAIFQNEAPFLKEWIEYHRLVGVDHFYLYSNLSTDNYQEVLQPYINNKIVDLIEWPKVITPERKWFTIQCDAYNTALKNYGNQTEWLAFIDIDEFIVPVEKNTILKALNEFGNVGGICVNWQLYGTSHVEKVPSDKLLIEMLLLKGKMDNIDNFHVKSIVRTKYVSHFQNAHYAFYKPGYFQVDENGTYFDGPRTKQISINKLRINHYWTRDEDYFNNVKLASRQKRGWSIERDVRLAEGLNFMADPAILKFVPKLRQKMGLD